MNETLAFIAMAAGLLFTPGPTNTLLAVGGAMAGLRRSLWLVPAELAGYLIAITCSASWPGPLCSNRRRPRRRCAWALRSLCSGSPSGSGRRRPISCRAGPWPRPKFLSITLLNPKALVFAFVVLPPLAGGQWFTALPWLGGLCLMVLAASHGLDRTWDQLGRRHCRRQDRAAAPDPARGCSGSGAVCHAAGVVGVALALPQQRKRHAGADQ